MTKVPAILLKIRNKLDLTQSQLAELLEVSVSAICNYERGIRTPQNNLVYRIINLAGGCGVRAEFKDFIKKDIA